MSNADGLGRMTALMEALGNPEKDLMVIHVAGTNGKGSTCVMIASILEEAGCSVGLYTSPHLETERERIQIWQGGDHRMIEQSDLDSLKKRVERSFAAASAEIDGRLTVFETYTAAAYLYFAEKKPDIVVLECGMGGRLDSTNTIESPLVSVITQVGLDHTDELGSTIEEVAANKAGIIKPGRPVVSQSDDERVRAVIRSAAVEKGSAFVDVASCYPEFYKEDPAGSDDRAKGEMTGLFSSHIAMTGEYQKKNAATAVCAIRAAGIEASDAAIRRGLEKAVLPGRFEILCEDPFLIIDGAHNPPAMRALVDEYSRFAKEKGIQKTVIIFGCMQDKDSSSMTEILTSQLSGSSFLTVSIDYGRAESADSIKQQIISAGCRCRSCASVEEALKVALESDAECILAAGSIYLAGDIRSLYKNGTEQ